MAFENSQVIGQVAEMIDERKARLINFSLKHSTLANFLSPVIDCIAHSIETFYRSPTTIEFGSTTFLPHNGVEDTNQFDDLFVKLLHVKSGHIFYVALDSNLSRTFLARLLASSLIDEKPGLLFSSTEKGLFSFIVARLIIELSKSLGDKMPLLKILGVFHTNEDKIKNNFDDDFLIHNFILNSMENKYILNLFIPLSMSNLVPQNNVNINRALERCRHINRNFSIIAHRFLVDLNTVKNMSCGDMIIFNDSTLSWSQKILQGSINAQWDQLFFKGFIFVKDSCYFFRFDHLQEEERMPVKAIEISNENAFGASAHEKKQNVSELVQNMRVAMSIEVSRLPMTLKEIGQLQSGQIIDLQQKIGDPLEMVIENKVIGYCTPIQINGRLGIKILDLNDDSE
ncbi:MAG: FliM/FliN family flagellar motor switch protein [Myxococcales bacterium]|nr:FliM/FliN family flagellar motor switch protein [Myxococcales bacterium]USN49873.1 MAG: FliM/FliN family flagellar motor switch protein [Myxococcales bacterium]